MQLTTTTAVPEIEALLADKQAFSAFLYTPLDQAIAALDERRNKPEIDAWLAQLPVGIPEPLREGKNAVFFRNVATPDFELRRFVSIAEAIADLRPVIMEYHDDLYTNRNECKFALGKICFHKGKAKTGDMIYEHEKIIDINDANRKKLHEIKTHWGQGLIEFHHELLQREFLDKVSVPVSIFDVSQWIHDSGKTPDKYYEAFLSIFLRNGILFENFMLNEQELAFTRNIVLPIFMKLYRETGCKPLIVSLQPTEIEGDKFWLSHPGESLDQVKRKLQAAP